MASASTRPHTGSAGPDRRPVGLAPRQLMALVDAIVEAVDVGRFDEIERLRTALEPLGAVGLFDDELRLSGLGCAWCSLPEVF